MGKMREKHRSKIRTLVLKEDLQTYSTNFKLKEIMFKVRFVLIFFQIHISFLQTPPTWTGIITSWCVAVNLLILCNSSV